jgi:hypothetical protein
MATSTDDGAAVVSQDLKPIADIIGVADSRHDAEGGAQEGAADFRDQFFARISGRSKAPGKIAVQPMLGPAPVRQLMQRRAIKIDRLVKAFLRRGVNRIGADVVVSLGIGAVEGGTRRRNQRLGGRDRQGLRNLLLLDGVIEWQAVALGDIENGKALEERNAPAAVLAAFRGVCAVRLWREGIGINDGCAALALPHIAAEGQRLLESQPAIDGEAVPKQRIP